MLYATSQKLYCTIYVTLLVGVTWWDLSHTMSQNRTFSTFYNIVSYFTCNVAWVVTMQCRKNFSMSLHIKQSANKVWLLRTVYNSVKFKQEYFKAEDCYEVPVGYDGCQLKCLRMFLNDVMETFDFNIHQNLIFCSGKLYDFTYVIENDFECKPALTQRTKQSLYSLWLHEKKIMLVFCIFTWFQKVLRS